MKVESKMEGFKGLGNIIIGLLIWFIRDSGKMEKKMVKESIAIEQRWS